MCILTASAAILLQGLNDDVITHIYHAAYIYNIDADWMLQMARCESRLNPNAVSENGLYHGLYQYSRTTWNHMSTMAGYGGLSPYDPEAAAQTTAWALSNGLAHHWPYCRYARHVT